MDTCISYSKNNERCKNNKINNSKHCEYHIKKCYKLYTEYKNTCNEAIKAGECMINNIDNLSMDKIKDNLKLFKHAYNKH